MIIYSTGKGVNDSLDHYLEDGWTVKSVTAEEVAITSYGQTTYPQKETVRSNFVIVLEKS